MDFLKELLVVSAGGAIGTALRFSVNTLFVRFTPDVVWPTLAVNVAGSFLITLIATLAAAEMLPPQWKIFLITGIMGGLTTYSAFNHAMIESLHKGEYAAAAVNAGLTVVLCLIAGFLALYVATRMTH